MSGVNVRSGPLLPARKLCPCDTRTVVRQAEVSFGGMSRLDTLRRKHKSVNW